MVLNLELPVLQIRGGGGGGGVKGIIKVIIFHIKVVHWITR